MSEALGAEETASANYEELVPADGDPRIGRESLEDLLRSLNEERMMTWLERAWHAADERTKKAFAVSLLRILLRKIDKGLSDYAVGTLIAATKVEFADGELEELKTVMLAKTIEHLNHRGQYNDDLFQRVVTQAATSAIEKGELAGALAEHVLTSDEP